MKIKNILLTGMIVTGLVGCGGGGGGGTTAPSDDRNLTVAASALVTGTNLSVDVKDSAGLVVSLLMSSTDTQTPTKRYSYLKPGDFTAVITKQPLNQLCVIDSGALGYVNYSGQPVTVSIKCHTTYLNDTGVYASVKENDDGAGGRDALTSQLTKRGSGFKGFDFTKICSDGQECTSAAWACVKDNITGLTWTRATSAWGTTAPNTCGFTDWRLPKVHELFSILNGSDAGGVDTNYFNAATKLAVSNEIYLDSAPMHWGVRFSTTDLAAVPPGFAGTVTDAVQFGEIRWVRDAGLSLPLTRAPNFRATSTSGVVEDANLGLMWWVPDTLSVMGWAAALDSLTTLNAVTKTGGFSDWRLPNRSELDSLIDRSRSNPAVSDSLKNLVSNPAKLKISLWSSTPVPALPTTEAWSVDFRTGDVSFNPVANNYGVIYVRDKTY